MNLIFCSNKQWIIIGDNKIKDLRAEDSMMKASQSHMKIWNWLKLDGILNYKYQKYKMLHENLH